MPHHEDLLMKNNLLSCVLNFASCLLDFLDNPDVFAKPPSNISPVYSSWSDAINSRLHKEFTSPR